MNLQLWSAQALKQHAFERPRMLCDPIIPQDGLVILHGPRASGKTQLALTLAEAVSTGGRFLEAYACTCGPVVYLQVDMTAQLMQERLQHGAEHLSCHFLTVDTVSLDLLDPRVVQHPAIHEVRALRPALIIIDSLRKTHTLDENESNSASRYFQAVRRLFPAGTLMILHHDRKLGLDAGGTRMRDEAFRGSSAWLDDVDTGLHLVRDYKRKTQTGEFRARLTYSKLRTCEEQPAQGLVFREDSLLMRPAELTAYQEAHLWMARNPHGGKAELVKYLRSLTNSRGKPTCSKATAYRVASEVGLEEAKTRVSQPKNVSGA